LHFTSGQRSSGSSSEAQGGVGGWPDSSSSDAEARLAAFLSCTSPAEFVALQRGVDMARLVRGLDDWSAVRLGALGPVPPEAAEVLNRKRAAFLITATREYGVAQAEVFALFVLHSAFDEDVKQVLRWLADDKRLGQTLGRMAVAREHLRRRGLPLSDYPDRPERPLDDSLRGAREGAGDFLSSAPMFQTGPMLSYFTQKGQLPPPYRHALDEVESALAKQALESGNVLLGLVDEMTFGVPLGFYHLAAGVGHGAYSLTQGQYEEATRELTPAALLVALYAGGKGMRALSEARGAPGTAATSARALQALEPRLEALKQTAERLREQLGGEGLEAVARYLRADPEAALLVAEGGEAGVAALYEARGNVPKAQAWLSETKSERPGSSRTRGGVGKGPGSVASLADEAAGLPREVLEAKSLEVEFDVPGPRLSGDVTMLEKQLAALEKTPPAGATGHPLWSEYLDYGKGRVADLRRGTKVKHGRPLEPPLKWEGYQQMRGLVLRGLAFERTMAKLLREDAALPRAQRRFLQDFNEPRVETYVGVHKPKAGLRFADVLVIEQKPLPGQPPRVETFSFKSRDFSLLKERALRAQIKADASEALGYYGETLDIRRPGLEFRVEVRRVRLIYEGGRLKPALVANPDAVVNRVQKDVPGVEVFFQ
jgi:tetratricopeptide (TPR) repeat protein